MSNEKDKERKRIIMPRKSREVEVISGDVYQSTDILIADAKMIVAAELACYRQKVSGGIMLGLKEARVVQGYLESLTKLQREEREQSRATDLSNLSNDELVALMSKLVLQPNPKLPSDE